MQLLLGHDSSSMLIDFSADDTNSHKLKLATMEQIESQWCQNLHFNQTLLARKLFSRIFAKSFILEKSSLSSLEKLQHVRSLRKLFQLFKFPNIPQYHLSLLPGTFRIVCVADLRDSMRLKMKNFKPILKFRDFRAKHWKHACGA